MARRARLKAELMPGHPLDATRPHHSLSLAHPTRAPRYTLGCCCLLSLSRLFWTDDVDGLYVHTDRERGLVLRMLVAGDFFFFYHKREYLLSLPV